MEYKNYEITIEQDLDAENPCAAWDVLGVISCCHPKYELGGKQLSVEEIEDIHTNKKEFISIPVYLYDHSGLTVSTTPFSCPWDSGQVGIVYIPKKVVRTEFKKQRISKKLLAEIKQMLVRTVELYDTYLTNDVWGYVIEKNGEYIDACFGFYGEYDYCLSEAKDMIDALIGDK